MTQRRGATIAWAAYGGGAGLMAVVAIVAWGRALLVAGPVLYGEGAVAHAAILTRTLETYRSSGGPTFTAANYPPLYFIGAALGDPFVTGRILSIAATLTVAGLIGWRARQSASGRGRLVPVVLALGWLALAPVAIWGPALKPDLVALALTVAAVLSLERRRAGLCAVLLVLAIVAKPTAIIVAIALLAWLVRRDRALLPRSLGVAAIALVVTAFALLPFGYEGLWRHVVVWNALPWSAEQAAPLIFLGVAMLTALVVGAVMSRAIRGPIAAYLVAAVVVALLGGREGATINYLLDLTAAASLALASVAPALARAPHYPAAALANLLIAVALINPLGIVPGRAATTGAWGDLTRLTSAEVALAGDEVVLAEDSGLLVATGHRVVIDDLFLWSRLVARGTIDPLPVLEDVRSARFTAIVSGVDLGHLGEAAAYEQARWEPSLVQAIELRYRLASGLPGGLFVYRPR